MITIINKKHETLHHIASIIYGSSLFVIIIGLTTVSCNNLDQTPNYAVTKGEYYKTESDDIASVNAVYAALTNEVSGEQSLYGRNLYFLTDMATDYAAAGASASNSNVRAISSITYDSNNDRVALAWEQIYRGIDRANLAIDNIPNSQADSNIKTRLVNEAKFLRGLLYFNAVQLWGDVPLVLHEAQSLDTNALNASRTNKDDIYAQIISDLTDAENLPASYSGTDIFRATSGAASSLLAKVYLKRKNWSKAAEYARKVISSGKYQLFERYYDVFAPASKNGKEHIFSAQYSLGQNGYSSRTGNTLVVTSFMGFSPVEPADISSDEKFYNQYEEGDQRRYVNYMKKLYNPNTGSYYVFKSKPLFRKYVDTTLIANGSWRSSEANFPIIRYADVLLVLAEAINEEYGPTAEAYNAINEVRRRAFGKDVYTFNSSIDLSGLSKDEFRSAIQDERLKEFVQEGQRWFDLVRWGKLVEEVSKIPAKSSITKRDTLFPIPLIEHDLNPSGLWQNPGY